MHRLLLPALLALALPAAAHVGNHPSIHDTIARVVDKIQTTYEPDKIERLRASDVTSILSEEEKHVLATEYWTFKVDVPVVVSVVFHGRQREIPIWLKDEGFTKTELEVRAAGQPFDVYQKHFEAGNVGLGYPGFDALRLPYFVVLSPQSGSGTITVTSMYPGRHSATEFVTGATIYVDEEDVVEEIPETLQGHLLLRGVEDRIEETQLLGVFRTTDYAATTTPDQITLTWSDDPKTTQTIQWRTNLEVEEGAVQYYPVAQPDQARIVPAEVTQLTDRLLVNDPVNNRYTVVLRDLQPGTKYAYRVGTGAEGAWGDESTFTTAPAEVVPFKFIYMGDAQNGLDTWGKLLQKADTKEPDAAFYIMAGDLVNRGVERHDWDSFFHNARGIYDRKQLVPCVGNHENQGERGPWMYLQLFDLPKNGPQGIGAERAYSFTYSNALFVVLDSNLPPKSQTAWLDQQLAASNAKWKFVIYHHPAYSSGKKRDNPVLRNEWTPLFDKYHVDMALQGHDHAYLRTYPMFNQERVDSAAEGTYYVVSVSGTKMYEQDEHDYTEVGFTNVATYQVLDITIEEDRLVYKAYDIDGNLKDEVVIEK